MSTYSDLVMIVVVKFGVLDSMNSRFWKLWKLDALVEGSYVSG
jgi:hypothetical protein